jgi:hypothetical protein
MTKDTTADGTLYVTIALIYTAAQFKPVAASGALVFVNRHPLPPSSLQGFRSRTDGSGKFFGLL